MRGRRTQPLALAGLALAVLALAGCETTRELLVDSDPQGAEVYVDGQLVGETPYVGQVTYTSEDHRVVVQVYEPGHLPERQVCRRDDRQNDVFVNLRPAPGQ